MPTATLRDTSAVLEATCEKCGEIHKAQVDTPRRYMCCNTRLTWPKAPKRRVKADGKTNGQGGSHNSASSADQADAQFEKMMEGSRAARFSSLPLEDRKRLGRLGELAARAGLERHEREWLDSILGPDAEVYIATAHARDRADHLIEKYWREDGPLPQVLTPVGPKSKKARHGSLPPGLTSTVTPGGIESNDRDAWPEEPRWQDQPEGQIVALDVLVIDPHPDNIDRTEQEILARMQSMREVGQLEPIVVWEHESGRYQILSGHTRWLAAKRLGWATIQARIVTGIDQAEALEFLARYNGERTDLNPIQKARLVAKLCEPKESGGAGLTRTQAAERVGLESGGAASNLVRLLELPKEWQDRVASGELPWTWAREMLSVVQIPPVLAELEKDWKEKDKQRPTWDENAFDSRNDLVEAIDRIIEDGDVCVALGDYHEKTFKIDTANPQTREQLGIIEIERPTGKKGKLEKVAIATNVKAFDAIVEKHNARKSKASAEKAGRDEPTPKRELTAAELKEKKAQRTKLRNERIADWRHRLLCRELIACVDQGLESGLRLVIAYAASPHYRGPSISQALEKATGKKGTGSSWQRGHYWAAVAQLDDDQIAEMAKFLLAADSKDWRMPVLPHALVERYAEDQAIDLADAWGRLQDMSGGKLAGGELLEELFLLHQTEELQEFAKELGVHPPTSVKTRAQLCKLLLGIPQGTTRRLPFPRARIKPVATVAKGKPAKKAKR